jgi:hypothetical protein
MGPEGFAVACAAGAFFADASTLLAGAATFLAGAAALLVGAAALVAGAATFFVVAGFVGAALRDGGALFLAATGAFFAGAAFFLAGATAFFGGAAFDFAAAVDDVFVAAFAAGLPEPRVGAALAAGFRVAGAAFFVGFTSLTKALAIFFTALGLADLDFAGALAALVRVPPAAGFWFLAAGLAADFLALLFFAATLVPMILGAQRSRVIA